MSNQTMQLLQLLKEGKTCNEICSILNLSNKQLFNNLTNLKNKGFLVKRKYYANGVINYQLIKKLSDYHKKSTNIITSHDDTELKVLLISDLHFGNSMERLDLLDKAFEYCVKNGIHIIFCCGDMIDGTFTKEKQTIEDTFMQIEHFIKDYPFDKNILTFGVAGDHDLNALTKSGQDIIEITRNYRHDIVIENYNNAIVNIKNDNILLFHNIIGGILKLPTAPIILHGHAHKYCVNMQKENSLHIIVPSLSDINSSFPTAVEMNLNFEKGYINSVYLKQVFFGERNYILSETAYDFLGRDITIKSINNEEILRTECLEDAYSLKRERLSQIEKFNQKYGL